MVHPLQMLNIIIFYKDKKKMLILVTCFITCVGLTLTRKIEIFFSTQKLYEHDVMLLITLAPTKLEDYA